MVLSKRFSIVAAVVGLIGAFVAPASAQTAEEIVARARTAMVGVVERTQGAAREIADSTCARIKELDANGASADELRRAAREGLDRLRGAGERGRQGVNEIARNAGAALKEINADRRFFRAVREAADRSHNGIGDATRHAARAIERCLREALK